MIQEGLKLTLLGMGVVFAFLGMLVVVIKLSALVMRPLTEREAAKRHSLPHKRRGPRQQQETEDRRRVLAVISAAIAAHRSQEASPAAHAKAAAADPLVREPQQGPRAQQTSTPAARRPPSLAGMFFRERTAFQVFLRK